TNVVNQNILESILITSDKQVLVWQAQDCSRDRVRTNDTVMHLIKQQENPDITFLPCFAHQANLCVGEIFKESQTYKETMKQAIQIATYFRSKNHIYFSVYDSNENSDFFRQSSFNEDILELPIHICDSVNSNDFWKNCILIKKLLLPYCGCLNILQRDAAKLYN
ncbi:9645_t:CDS:2, partial [Racocetra persica]